MIRGKRCCVFAYAQTKDSENPALLGCCCPIDGNYPAILIKSGSKDNDLLRQPRDPRSSARGVHYQTVNVNDDFWDNWARRQGCSLQVTTFACASVCSFSFYVLTRSSLFAFQFFAATVGIGPCATTVQASSERAFVCVSSAEPSVVSI
jgi:hypothetical protein